MPRRPWVPEALRHGPFTIEEALVAGITPDHLRGKAWEAVAKGWYRWVGWSGDIDPRLLVIADGLPAGGGFAGVTAARLHGLPLPEPSVPEVVVPDSSRVSRRGDARVRCVQLAPGDVIWRDGLPVTSPLRTCFDLAGHLPLGEGLVAVDLALHAGLIDLESFSGYIAAKRGVAGVVGARRVLALAEPRAESPMETKLRLLLVRNGLPRPEAQVELFDAQGRFVARVDLYYPESRLALEYDGENHRDRLVDDNRRQNALLGIGVNLLRFTGPDLRDRPDLVVRQVRDALARRPESPFRHTPGLPGAS